MRQFFFFFFLLRLGNEILAPILSFYFGPVFEFGIFTQIFKTAKVAPIFKFGDKHLVHSGDVGPLVRVGPMIIVDFSQSFWRIFFLF